MIDAHTHIASPDVDRYPMRPLGGGGTQWWRDPLTAERLLAEMDATGVERAVVVHAFGAYSFDCRYTIDGAMVDPSRLAAVVAADASSPDAPGVIRAVTANPVVGGVRLFAARPEDAAWLADSAAAAVWHACGDAGCNVVLVALAAHIADVEPVLRATPEVATVIDHCAMPVIEHGVMASTSPVLAFADLPHVHMKVTTPLLRAAAADGSPRRLVHQLVDAFGADRVLWGSDYPQTTGLDYAAMVALARDATSDLVPGARDQVLHENSARLWFGPRHAAAAAGGAR